MEEATAAVVAFDRETGATPLDPLRCPVLT